MGHRLDPVAARQRPDLTETQPPAADEGGATDPAIRFVVLALLAVDGALSAVVGALLMPWYIGAIPFPVSALISGLVNAALVWAAGHWTGSPRVAALPLWTWLLTVVVMVVGGPGDDVILGGRGPMAHGALILIVLGAAPPAWVLRRHRVSRATATAAAAGGS
ncbi:hypothetical protein H7H78_08815 [Mycobacterium shinjukuense]|uniref:Uncharacterized protein n=1 Tax=Mycobacterium shinjukuense TaxID=398694 RepID=A0A7I7MJG4_9MYCO|nr:hypothetical protein [Mycobacterium shinjukuense]MCV6985530.1 hypothetical protein [Mycobacterium shinjukuense]ORB64901.1 hypothetical protein BST45_15785 [Mycobacterium shinjukuense]BBX72474.1 hypothetical protein MSHI_03800 [Mycobacterium shinjukuense]